MDAVDDYIEVLRLLTTHTVAVRRAERALYREDDHAKWQATEDVADAAYKDLHDKIRALCGQTP